MTKPEKKNLPASIHERLLNKAKSSGRPFNELLQYYAIERFLYRLAQSPYRDRLILKGALIFAAWGAPLSRPTRDIDLLAHTSNAIDNIVAIVTAICNQDVQPDGITFDPASVVGEKIKEQDEYEGVRVRFRGYLGNARVNMQVDMGFADVVSPAPELV
ncbi:MAG TPA: nucleotidyl transferase AbiEii/AbiGii toxin family protein, partial [Anaerolineae bacterium]